MRCLNDSGKLSQPLPPTASGGSASARCASWLQAMKGIGPLVDVRGQVEQLVSNPVSSGVEVDERKVVVGGVRLKVRRDEKESDVSALPRS